MVHKPQHLPSLKATKVLVDILDNSFVYQTIIGKEIFSKISIENFSCDSCMRGFKIAFDAKPFSSSLAFLSEHPRKVTWLYSPSKNLVSLKQFCKSFSGLWDPLQR